jgi:hypothetical protein
MMEKWDNGKMERWDDGSLGDSDIA